MKPKLRNEASLEFHYALVAASYRTIEHAYNYPFQNCLNCRNFNEQTEICKLANQRPPAKVIAYGCNSHDDVQEIPF